MTWSWDTILLAVIAIVLIRESVIRHGERLAERLADERRRQRCADAYNHALYRNFTRWLDTMTAEGYEPQFVSIRKLTPGECGIEKWNLPDDFWKADIDWRNAHPDRDQIFKECYSDRQREEMARPDWDEIRKQRIESRKNRPVDTATQGETRH
jgi:hypothetical protein